MATNASPTTPTNSAKIAPLRSCGPQNAMSYVDSVKSTAANKTPPGKQQGKNNETDNQDVGQVGVRTGDDAGGPEQLASDEQRAAESTSWVALNDQERRRVAGEQGERAGDDESPSATSRALPRGACSAVVTRPAGASQLVESLRTAIQVDPRPARGRRRRKPSGSARQQRQQQGDGAQLSGTQASTACRLGGHQDYRDSADEDNNNFVSLTQQQLQQQVDYAQGRKLDDGHSAATSLRCSAPDARETVASAQAARPSTPAGGLLRVDRSRNKRGGAAGAHGRPRETSVLTAGGVDQAVTATACCSNLAKSSISQVSRGGARQVLATATGSTATCSSQPIAGGNCFAHVSVRRATNCKANRSESTAARAVAKRCNANDDDDEGGNNNHNNTSDGAKSDAMFDTNNDSNKNTSKHKDIITTANHICDNNNSTDQINITCNLAIATETLASFTNTITTSNTPPPSQSLKAPSQPSQEQSAPTISESNATVAMQQEVPTPKRPANNRSILILREIDSNAPESSVRDLFNSENCPSKPVHCEYALQNSWYVTFADDEDARLALAHIRKHVVEWNGKPIMARYKPKPAIASAANQPPPHLQHHHHHQNHLTHPHPHLHPHHQHLHHQHHHQHHLMSGYNPYYAAPQSSIASAQWDLSTVFVLNGLSPYSKTSVSGVSLLGNNSDPA